jgi:hypothetical protein
MFLIYKLPSIAENVLADEFGQLCGLVPEGRRDIADFLSTISCFLKKERSWFALEIVYCLKSIFQTADNTKCNSFSCYQTYLTPKYIFEMLLERYSHISRR